jgi:Flp pilus assembly pilin Flp
MDVSLKARFWTLLRDEKSITTYEYSIVFALIAILICASSAVGVFNSRNTTCTAMAIPASASITTLEWNSDTTFNERYYRIHELSQMWALGRETVRLIVKDEPGVIKIRQGRKKSHTIYSVPESVAQRIHARLVNTL